MKDRAKAAAKQRAYYVAHRDELIAYQKTYLAANRDRVAASRRAYYEEHRDEILAKKRAYHRKVTVARRDNQLRRLYGLTREEVREILASQGGRCAICRRPLTDGGRGHDGLQVDHEHGGIPRGILCGSCNPGLGHFKDNPEFLRRAAEYLERHEIEAKFEEALVRWGWSEAPVGK